MRKDIVRSVKITRNMKVKLNDQELREMGDKVAFLASDIKAKKREKKQFMQQNKADTDELEVRREGYEQKIRERSEYRMIECEQVYNYALGTVAVVRLDTKEEVSCRAMSAAERSNTVLPGFEPELDEDAEDEPVNDNAESNRNTGKKKPTTMTHGWSDRTNEKPGGIKPPKKKPSKKASKKATKKK